jgi:N-acetylglucosamine-6-phosphate deacetylase
MRLGVGSALVEGEFVDGDVALGARANLVVLDDSLELTQVILEGKSVF